ncbi:MAG: hypothetical protein HY721_29555 [Planctomycetes bacterium]|nr:hypothetical protein [Planctomycetota bacterium]
MESPGTPAGTPAGGPPGAAERSGIQKINVKLPLDAPRAFENDVLLAIFGRWRLEQGEEIIDLADYAHVDHGPGCLLVSHRWHFGIDNSEGVPGLFFSTRKGLSGSPAERFAQAIRGLLEKGRRLLGEADFPQGVRPRCGELEVVLNDRLLAPNDDDADRDLRPALETVLARLYGQGAWSLERERDPGRRLAYRVRAKGAGGLELADLLQRLG